jgi:hypothetical protein
MRRRLYACETCDKAKNLFNNRTTIQSTPREHSISPYVIYVRLLHQHCEVWLNKTKGAVGFTSVDTHGLPQEGTITDAEKIPNSRQVKVC